MMTQSPGPAPMCSNCSYSFEDLTTLERCPECGASVLESLAAEQHRESGRRRTSSRIVRGLPIYDIVVRPGSTPESQHARGWIAIGPKATGGIALGAVAKGIVAIGAVSMGGITMGATSIGLLSIGAVSLGLLVTGGVAVGGFAQGPVSVGASGQGNVAVGVISRGNVVVSPSEIAGKSTAEMSSVFFDTLGPLVGNHPSWMMGGNAVVWAAVVPAMIGVIVCLAVAGKARSS